MAGEADYAFAREESFKGALFDSSASVVYWEPGRNPTVTDLELSRALERQRQPDAVFSTQSVAQNMEGAFAIEFTVESANLSDVHDAIFNASSPTTITSGLAQTSRWFMGLDYIDSTSSVATAERELIGCAPVDYEITYQQGGSIRCQITFIYADESFDTTIDPSSVNEATGDTAQFHGMDLSINTTTQIKEQSVTLSISNMSRFDRGSGFKAIDAVVGAPTVSLDLTATVSSTDNLSLAYGGTTNTTTAKNMTDVSGTLDLNAAGTTIASYSLSKMKPTSHAWEELFSADTSAQERITWNIDGEPAISIT